MNKVKVLLIDDDEDDFIITKDVFSQLPFPDHYELSWIDNFEKGINAVLKHQYDIYLVDYRLGRETGISLLNEAVLSGVKEPIIILTGKGDYSIDEEAMNRGAADYLVKDRITPDTLDRALRYALKQGTNLKTIAESESKFRITFDKAKDPFIISDFSGRILDMNKAGLAFFGVQHSALDLVSDRNLFVNPEDRNRFIELLDSKGAVTDFECYMHATNGNAYLCSLSSTVQIDTKNMSEIYHTIVHDLSYRKQQETKLINQSKILISESIAKGFSQEIRNPLSTIYLALHDLANEQSLAFNEFVQSNVEIIKSQVAYINNLLENLIISTTYRVPARSQVQINPLIDEALLAVDDLLQGQRVELQNFVLTTQVELKVDASQIKTALVNVLGYAINMMVSYPKVLTVSSINDSGYYSIQIEGNGKPLSSDAVERLFEPFSVTQGEDKGLSLIEAERIILAHGGQIELKPQVDGNLFILKLPIEA
jgi:PAS domain S-box-containing protein